MIQESLKHQFSEVLDDSLAFYGTQRVGVQTAEQGGKDHPQILKTTKDI